jgi:hypothetical protein
MKVAPGISMEGRLWRINYLPKDHKAIAAGFAPGTMTGITLLPHARG